LEITVATGRKENGDTNEAKDLVQELFIDIWNRRTRLAIKGSLQTYLVAALYLKIFRHFRTKGFRAAHYLHFENYLVQTGQNVEQLHTARSLEEQEVGNMTEIIEAAIALMPEQMRPGRWPGT
jgi:DNA-directed RNA polymerase specialized sigma24 family protein